MRVVNDLSNFKIMIDQVSANHAIVAKLDEKWYKLHKVISTERWAFINIEDNQCFWSSHDSFRDCLSDAVKKGHVHAFNNSKDLIEWIKQGGMG